MSSSNASPASGNAGGPSSAESGPSARTSEWAAARSNIERFDGYLNDLRKYGFGLVTTLLTVTGYLSASPATSLPYATKLAVGGAILVLVVALAFLDGQYRALQRGATIRARVLEKSLNLDLTGSMAHYARLGRFRISYPLVYEMTAAAVFVVGVGVLWGGGFYELVWLAVFGVAVVLVAVFGDEAPAGTFDWSVDAKIVARGRPVRVTFTCLEELQDGPWLWAGGRIQGIDSDYSYPLPWRRMRTHFLYDMSWVWPTDGPAVREGLYRLVGLWYPPPDNEERPVPSHLPAAGATRAARRHEDDRYARLSADDAPSPSAPPGAVPPHVYTLTVQVVAPGSP